MKKYSLFKAIITSVIGNLFEWYDFALFAYFAPIIGQLFFPSENKIAELLCVFGAFAAGYVSRPLGGIFFGYLSDCYGRKIALFWTIMLMAIPTFIIGILPTYESIGFYAPVILIIVRILQGLSMGGNYGGSITFVSEHSGENNRGLFSSFSVASCLCGLMLGSGTVALFSVIFTEENLVGWAWRIPFLMGIFICFVGVYIKRNAEETPQFQEIENSGEVLKNPFAHIYENYKKRLASMVFIVMLHDLSFYIIFIYMTTHLTEFLKLSKGVSFIINTANMLFVILITIFSAWLSDLYGRKKILIVAASIFLVGAIPCIHMINSTNSPWIVFLCQSIIAIGVGGYFGPLPALLVEAYPTAIRGSAISLTSNISGPLFGGTAPYLITYLIDIMGTKMVPAYYITLGSVISLMILMRLKIANEKQS